MMEEKDILAQPVGTEDNIEKKYDKYKTTLPKQFRSVFLSSLASSVVMTVIGMFALLGVFDASDGKPGIWQILVAAVMIIIHFFVIYSSTYSIGDHDTKSFSTLKPYKTKGLVLCVPVIAVTLILFIAYKLVWTFIGVDTINHGIASSMLSANGMETFASWFDKNEQVRVLSGAGAVALNLAYIIWIFPFYGLILPTEGAAGIIGVILSFVVPAAAGFVGYISGCRHFDMSVAFRNLVYEKNK